MALKLKMSGDVVSDAASKSASTVSPSPVAVQMEAPSGSSPGAGRFKPAETIAPSSISEKVRQEVQARVLERNKNEARARRNKAFRVVFLVLLLLVVVGSVLWYFGFVQRRAGRLAFSSEPDTRGRDAVEVVPADPTTLFGQMGRFLGQNLKQTGSNIAASVKDSASALRLGGAAAKIGNALSNVTSVVEEKVQPETKEAVAAAAPDAAKPGVEWPSLRLDGLFVDKTGARLACINGQMLKAGAEIAGVRIAWITDKSVTLSKGAETRRIKVGDWL